MEQAFPFVIVRVCKKEGDMEGARSVLAEKKSLG